MNRDELRRLALESMKKPMAPAIPSNPPVSANIAEKEVEIPMPPLVETETAVPIPTETIQSASPVIIEDGDNRRIEETTEEREEGELSDDEPQILTPKRSDLSALAINDLNVTLDEEEEVKPSVKKDNQPNKSRRPGNNQQRRDNRDNQNNKKRDRNMNNSPNNRRIDDSRRDRDTRREWDRDKESYRPNSPPYDDSRRDDRYRKDQRRLGPPLIPLPPNPNHYNPMMMPEWEVHRNPNFLPPPNQMPPEMMGMFPPPMPPKLDQMGFPMMNQMPFGNNFPPFFDGPNSNFNQMPNQMPFEMGSMPPNWPNQMPNHMSNQMQNQMSPQMQQNQMSPQMQNQHNQSPMSFNGPPSAPPQPSGNFPPGISGPPNRKGHHKTWVNKPAFVPSPNSSLIIYADQLEDDDVEMEIVPPPPNYPPSKNAPTVPTAPTKSPVQVEETGKRNEIAFLKKLIEEKEAAKLKKKAAPAAPAVSPPAAPTPTPAAPVVNHVINDKPSAPTVPTLARMTKARDEDSPSKRQKTKTIDEILSTPSQDEGSRNHSNGTHLNGNHNGHSTPPSVPTTPTAPTTSTPTTPTIVPTTPTHVPRTPTTSLSITSPTILNSHPHSGITYIDVDVDEESIFKLKNQLQLEEEKIQTVQKEIFNFESDVLQLQQNLIDSQSSQKNLEMRIRILTEQLKFVETQHEQQAQRQFQVENELRQLESLQVERRKELALKKSRLEKDKFRLCEMEIELKVVQNSHEFSSTSPLFIKTEPRSTIVRSHGNTGSFPAVPETPTGVPLPQLEDRVEIQVENRPQVEIRQVESRQHPNPAPVSMRRELSIQADPQVEKHVQVEKRAQVEKRPAPTRESKANGAKTKPPPTKPAKTKANQLTKASSTSVKKSSSQPILRFSGSIPAPTAPPKPAVSQAPKSKEKLSDKSAVDKSKDKSKDKPAAPVDVSLHRREPYDHTVLALFGSYRLTPGFLSKEKITSLTWSNKIDPDRQFCRFDLHGTCNDEECGWQHHRELALTEDELFTELASYSQDADVSLKIKVIKETSGNLEEKARKLIALVYSDISPQDRIGLSSTLTYAKKNASQRRAQF
eukprot:TRINITY_DN7386_c0_g1_i2.p1 TRINITY_DN7386_c0_g1~~TRINITY_DN7386_c0_g1_i2.p1  ORF type:complete len:1080 (+),score=392.46 TRINITY_DN7386_c0_g1_i2:12-3251(+)